MTGKTTATKNSVVLVYTGDSKGKTSASLGLMTRALGNRWDVAFIQFIKYWGVGEQVFIRDIMPLFKDQLHFYKGGRASTTLATCRKHRSRQSNTNRLRSKRTKRRF